MRGHRGLDAAEADEERCEEEVDRREDALDDRADDDAPSNLHIALGVCSSSPWIAWPGSGLAVCRIAAALGVPGR